MVLVIASNFVSESLPTNFCLFIKKFVDSDLAPKFENMMSAIISILKVKLFIFVKCFLQGP